MFSPLQFLAMGNLYSFKD